MKKGNIKIEIDDEDKDDFVITTYGAYDGHLTRQDLIDYRDLINQVLETETVKESGWNEENSSHRQCECICEKCKDCEDQPTKPVVDDIQITLDLPPLVFTPPSSEKEECIHGKDEECDKSCHKEECCYRCSSYRICFRVCPCHKEEGKEEKLPSVRIKEIEENSPMSQFMTMQEKSEAFLHRRINAVIAYLDETSKK